MQARVLKIAADQIYLEVDKQVRFSSRFCLECQPDKLHPNDLVDFIFADHPGDREIIIRRVTRSVGERAF